MKKTIIIIFTSVLFFVSLVIIFDHKIISFYISKNLSKAIGQKTVIDSISTNYDEGLIIFNEFKILNKNAFSSKYIFEADQILININLKSIFSNLVIINSIKILNPKLFIEIKESNDKEKKSIQDNINIVEKIKESKEKKIYPKKSKDKNFFISKTDIKNFKVHIKYPYNLEKYDIKLSDIILSNIGNTNKESKYESQHYKDAFKLIYRDIYLRITDQRLRAYIKKHYKL
tara:strand:+ start:128 stop:817 length:690 start_codon:yes stop_codon:yes gene_type:complete